MAADTTQLQGEIMEDPTKQDIDVEAFLFGFLRALLDEQRRATGPSAPAPAPAGSVTE